MRGRQEEARGAARAAATAGPHLEVPVRDRQRVAVPHARNQLAEEEARLRLGEAALCADAVEQLSSCKRPPFPSGAAQRALRAPRRACRVLHHDAQVRGRENHLSSHKMSDALRVSG